jgi:hypothetical protein
MVFLAIFQWNVAPLKQNAPDGRGILKICIPGLRENTQFHI